VAGDKIDKLESSRGYQKFRKAGFRNAHEHTTSSSESEFDPEKLLKKDRQSESAKKMRSLFGRQMKRVEARAKQDMDLNQQAYKLAMANMPDWEREEEDLRSQARSLRSQSPSEKQAYDQDLKQLSKSIARTFATPEYKKGLRNRVAEAFGKSFRDGANRDVAKGGFEEMQEDEEEGDEDSGESRDALSLRLQKLTNELEAEKKHNPERASQIRREIRDLMAAY